MPLRTGLQVRKDVCTYMSQNRCALMSSIAEEDRDAYLKRMRRQGEWGDHCEMVAASRVYVFHFIIWKNSTTHDSFLKIDGSLESVFWKEKRKDEIPTFQFHLQETFQDEENHYVPLKDLFQAMKE